MPAYRIYLSDGRQIDIDAHGHRMLMGDKSLLQRVDFFNKEGTTVASFTTPALQGFTETGSLVRQEDK